MKIAQIQMPVSADKSANIQRACNMIRWSGQIDMAVLPEMFCCPYDNALFRDYAEEEGGEAYQAMSALAKEKGIYLVGGSIPELCGEKLYNTCYVFDPQGRCIARHRKTHLFDIDVEGGQSFRESDVFAPGRDVTIVSFDANRTALLMIMAGEINCDVECNPLHGPRVRAVIEQLERGETPLKYTYVEENAFDGKGLSQELIDSRGY